MTMLIDFVNAYPYLFWLSLFVFLPLIVEWVLFWKLLKDCKILIDIESNQTAQLSSLIKQNLLREPDYYVLKYTGRAMTCDEIYDSLKKIVLFKSKEIRRFLKMVIKL